MKNSCILVSRNLMFLGIILLLTNCSSNKKIFLKAGDISLSSSWNYCSDSLGIFNEFYGNYSENNKNFFKKKLSKNEKKILKTTNFERAIDKVLYHSDFGNKKNKFHESSIIGIYKNNINLSDYQKIEVAEGVAFVKLDYVNKVESIVYPLSNGKYFMDVYYPLGISKKDGIPNHEFVYFDSSLIQIQTNLSKIKNKKCISENFIELGNIHFSGDSLKDYTAYETFQSRIEKINKKEVWNFVQMYATYLSFAQKNKEANAVWNNFLGDGYKKKKIKKLNISINDVVKKVKNEKLVVINEAHHLANHRYLTGSLLKKLYNEGFRYFGLEAISEIKAIDSMSFPVQSSGFYTSESTMANLIREAKKIGFTVFEYDDFNTEDRETTQANNVYNKTFGIDKDAKVLIHCGFSHANEDENSKKVWFAAKMNQLYKINPFTISQTNYRKTNKRKPLLEIFYDKEILKHDMFLQNSLSIENNCFSLRTAKSVSIPINRNNLKPVIILVYDKNEFEKVNNPIPVFLKVIEKNDKYVKTNLCLGDYIVITKDTFNEIIEQKNLLIE